MIMDINENIDLPVTRNPKPIKTYNIVQMAL